jgi:hypothetical protein
MVRKNQNLTEAYVSFAGNSPAKMNPAEAGNPQGPAAPLLDKKAGAAAPALRKLKRRSGPQRSESQRSTTLSLCRPTRVLKRFIVFLPGTEIGTLFNPLGDKGDLGLRPLGALPVPAGRGIRRREAD